MTGLPKIVKSRLRQAQGTGVSAHPDADLLTAFTEQALTPAEREQVLDHLSTCADCREVLTLSAPDAELLPAGDSVRRGLFGLPPEFFRWGIVAASAAVVVAAVLLVRPELGNRNFIREETAGVASQKAPMAPQTAAKGSVLPQEQDASAELLRRKAKVADKKTADEVATQSVKPESERAKQVPANPAVPPARDAQFAAAPVPAPPVTARGGQEFAIKGSQGGVLGGVMQVRPTDQVRADALSAAVKNEPVAPPAKVDAAKKDDAVHEKEALSEKEARQRIELADASALQIETKTKDGAGPNARGDKRANTFDMARTADSSEGSAAAASRAEMVQLQKAVAKSADARPRTWRIMEGKLEWSLDAGKSWQKVNAPGGARFLSVDSRRANVWAGGTSGVVVRSMDNGSTWVPVTTGWTGDVVYLKFDDERHGTLKTSTGEAWFTDDGGASWQKK